jgi:hypothetical protein
VNVAEATLAKQADFRPCGSVNIGTISKTFFYTNQNLLSIPMKRIIR